MYFQIITFKHIPCLIYIEEPAKAVIFIYTYRPLCSP